MVVISAVKESQKEGSYKATGVKVEIGDGASPTEMRSIGNLVQSSAQPESSGEICSPGVSLVGCTSQLCTKAEDIQALDWKSTDDEGMIVRKDESQQRQKKQIHLDSGNNLDKVATDNFGQFPIKVEATGLAGADDSWNIAEKPLKGSSEFSGQPNERKKIRGRKKKRGRKPMVYRKRLGKKIDFISVGSKTSDDDLDGSMIEDFCYSKSIEITEGGDGDKSEEQPAESCSSMEPQKSEGGALWDIFRREDSLKLQEYLRRHSREFRHVHCLPVEQVIHPIHDQSFYLTVEHKRKLKAEYGIEPWTFEQKLGEAVLIPAGCPHQVRNLKSCIKVALDFVSPENVRECLRLTEEFRKLPDEHKAKEDKLEIKKIAVHALNHVVKDLEVYIPWYNAKSNEEPVIESEVEEKSKDETDL